MPIVSTLVPAGEHYAKPRFIDPREAELQEKLRLRLLKENAVTTLLTLRRLSPDDVDIKVEEVEGKDVIYLSPIGTTERLTIPPEFHTPFIEQYVAYQRGKGLAPHLTETEERERTSSDSERVPTSGFRPELPPPPSREVSELRRELVAAAPQDGISIWVLDRVMSMMERLMADQAREHARRMDSMERLMADQARESARRMNSMEERCDRLERPLREREFEDPRRPSLSSGREFVSPQDLEALEGRLARHIVQVGTATGAVNDTNTGQIFRHIDIRFTSLAEQIQAMNREARAPDAALPARDDRLQELALANREAMQNVATTVEELSDAVSDLGRRIQAMNPPPSNANEDAVRAHALARELAEEHVADLLAILEHAQAQNQQMQKTIDGLATEMHAVRDAGQTDHAEVLGAIQQLTELATAISAAQRELAQNAGEQSLATNQEFLRQRETLDRLEAEFRTRWEALREQQERAQTELLDTLGRMRAASEQQSQTTREELQRLPDRIQNEETQSQRKTIIRISQQNGQFDARIAALEEQLGRAKEAQDAVMAQLNQCTGELDTTIDEMHVEPLSSSTPELRSPVPASTNPLFAVRSSLPPSPSRPGLGGFTPSPAQRWTPARQGLSLVPAPPSPKAPQGSIVQRPLTLSGTTRRSARRLSFDSGNEGSSMVDSLDLATEHPRSTPRRLIREVAANPSFEPALRRLGGVRAQLEGLEQQMLNLRFLLRSPSDA